MDSSADFVLTFQIWLRLIGYLVWLGISLWMLIDAIRRREWMWVVILLALPGIGLLWYFFCIYRSGGPNSGFELPGAQSRRRIKELEAQIHHLDKPHHHSQLGDVYFQQGKMAKAERSEERRVGKECRL